MFSNPFKGVFGCNEIVERIASYLTWPMWVHLSNVDRGTRDVLHGAVRTRMRFFISRFIDWKDQAPDFFRLLESTDALVAGAVVRCILSVDTYYLYQDINPLQLNIVVPYGRQDLMSDTDSGTLEYRRWRRYLYGCGYRDEYGASPCNAPKHLSVTAKTWSVLTKVSGSTAGMKLELQPLMIIVLAYEAAPYRFIAPEQDAIRFEPCPSILPLVDFFRLIRF